MMAYESSGSSKSRFSNGLSRSRPSSPYDENVYMTATGTSFQDVLHSTPLRGESSPVGPHMSNSNYLPEAYDDDGSTDMSIEVGRGHKRRPHEDVSSEGIFNFGKDDSQYEITTTPPTRNIQRKTEASLRKDASVRRAMESIKANDVSRKIIHNPKVRSMSDTLPKTNAGNDDSLRDFVPYAAPIASRNTRFTGLRQPSATGRALPTRFVSGQGLDFTATVQSTSFTANQSFMLPDIPDITELVSGVRRGETPRIAKSRSRFISGSFQPQTHRQVESIPLPDEEKAIFVSVQTLKDRISELEAERMRFEEEVNSLRNKIENESKEGIDTGPKDNTLPLPTSTKASHVLEASLKTLEASLKTVQDQCYQSERERVITQISLQRVTQERDIVITQIATAYDDNEQLINENNDLRASRDRLLEELNGTKHDVEMLRMENADLKASRQDNTYARGVSESRSESKPGRGDNDRTHERSDEKYKTTIEADIASRIERERRRRGQEAAASTKRSRRVSENVGSATSRPRSRSRSRTAAVHADLEVSDAESTTELNLTQKSQQSQAQSEHGPTQTVDQDVTILSDLDEGKVANLRRKIEEEHRNKRLQKNTSSSTAAQARRRSSLKSTNGALDDVTGRFSTWGEDNTKTTKTVRVQSPHTSDATMQSRLPIEEAEIGDISILSNTSRRRRRASSSEGMTSAFIIPDITIHSDTQAGMCKSCIAHNAAKCTICQRDDTKLAVPIPIPASERVISDEVTDVTIRPSQPPALALATVIKHLEDEITHLKIQREAQNRLYNRHEPAISKRQRLRVKAKLDTFTAEIEKRSDQVYALYDALEGQKQQLQHQQQQQPQQDEGEVEETLLSVGIDPVEISGKIGRNAPAGLDETEDWSDDGDEHPWEGLSENGSMH